MIECFPCPAGSFSGVLGAGSASTCARCPAGKYSGVGALACAACPAGKQSHPGFGACWDCSTTPRLDSSLCVIAPFTDSLLILQGMRGTAF